MTISQEIDQWLKKMDDEGLSEGLSYMKLAMLFLKLHPEKNYKLLTVKANIYRSRHNIIRPHIEGLMTSFAEDIKTNIEEAKRGFMVSLDNADFQDPLINLVDFPTSWAEINDPYVVEGVKRLGICNDIHLPYHDKFAVQACFAEFKKRQVDAIYLNGDIMDMEDISRFEKAPDGRYLKDEINVGRSFIKSLRQLFPEIPIYWKDGNHEKRLQSFISSRCPELVDLFGMDIPTQLNFKENNIIYIPEYKVAKFGKLWIAHGHELGLKSGTVNIARQVRMRVGVNVIFGHWHKNQTDTSRNLADEVHGAWAIGCLAYLKPRYTGVLNQWTQGGATVDLNDDGSFQVNPFQIADGVVI